jgi:hypothetical protein
MVSHGQRDVRLVIDRPCNGGDRAARYEFPDEDYCPTDLIRALTPYIEAKVHFLEIAMTWYRYPEYASVKEAERNHAEVRTPIMHVQLRARRDVWSQDGLVRFVVQHQQIAPLRG